MITVQAQFHDGEELFCPIYRCDSCKEQIKDLRSGVVDFRLRKDLSPDDDRFVEVHHRTCCSPAVGAGKGWMGLQDFHIALGQNSRSSTSRAL